MLEKDIARTSHSGLPINSTLHLNETAPVVINDGGVWLRSGVLENDLTVYPHATAAVSWTLEKIDLTFDSLLEDILWDGSHFWFTSRDLNLIQADADFVPTGVTLQHTGFDASPQGLTFDGTYYYVVGTAERIVRLDSTMARSTAGDISGFIDGETDLRAIVFADGFLWVTIKREAAVVQFTLSGERTGKVIPVEAYGLAFDGQHIWTINGFDLKKYTTDGDYTGERARLSTRNGVGITWKNDSLYVLDSDESVRRYTRQVGLFFLEQNSTTNLIKYIKVA